MIAGFYGDAGEIDKELIDPRGESGREGAQSRFVVVEFAHEVHFCDRQPTFDHRCRDVGERAGTLTHTERARTLVVV